MRPAAPEPSNDSSHDRTVLKPTSRQPRLVDLMLLVAATGLGIVGTRNCDRQMRLTQIDRRHPVNLIVLASPLFMSGSLALLVARLLPPRPRRSDVFRQPGFTASWVTALFIGIHTLTMFMLNPDKLSNLEFIQCFDYGYFWRASAESGGGVLVAWMTLALAGCWRAEPNWIDRSGRVLGAVWITAFAADRFNWLL